MSTQINFSEMRENTQFSNGKVMGPITDRMRELKLIEEIRKQHCSKA